jgi:uncharacterized protein involved in exopolysaccharide biosynthesis
VSSGTSTKRNSMTAPATIEAQPGNEDVSLLTLGSFVLRQRKLIVQCALTLFVVVVAAKSFGERLYTSTASFSPKASVQSTALAGVAAQLGVATPGTDAAQSPAFYADLLKSRSIMTAVLKHEYSYSDDGEARRGTLIDLLRVSGSTEGLKLKNANTKLTALSKVDLKVRTGVVTLTVRLPNPELAKLVVEQFLTEVNRYNLDQRQSLAGAERRFTDGRITQLKAELRDAEDRLEAFLRQNRDYRNSPELTFQRERLARAVELRQAVYTTVAQANEKARIDEARDTPAITLVDEPNLPARPEGRGRTMWGAVALLFGAALGCVLGFLRESMNRRKAAADPEFVEFSAATAAARNDLARVFGRFRR